MTAAAADPRVRKARMIDERARQAFAAGRFDEAAELFAEAARLLPDEAIYLYNVARARHRGKHCDDARREYRTFLDRAKPDDRSRAKAQRFLDDIEAGRDADCPAVAAKPAKETPDPPADPPADTKRPDTVARAKPHGPAPRSKTPAWILAGSGTALVTAGVVIWIAGSAKLDALDADAARTQPGPGGVLLVPGLAQIEAESRRDSVNRLRVTGALVGLVGLAAAGTGVFLALGRADEPRAWWRVSPSGAGLAFQF